MSDAQGSPTGDEGGNPNAALRVARDERDRALAALTGIQRRMAADDAGLDVKNNAQHRYFVEHYDGDLSPDAMKTQAELAGFLTSAQQQEQQEADASTAALGRVAATGAGGGASQATPKTEKDVKLRERAKVLMHNAKTRQGSADDVYEWAQDAGVPFLGDDG